MNQQVKLIIEGYNQEKLILSEKLSLYGNDDNGDMVARSAISSRLKEIDDRIEKLIIKLPKEVV